MRQLREREREEEENFEKGGQEEDVVIRVIHIDKVAARINATLTLVFICLGNWQCDTYRTVPTPYSINQGYPCAENTYKNVSHSDSGNVYNCLSFESFK